MKTRLQKSIEYIKGYCDKHDDCEKCKLYDSKNEWCGIRDKIPEDWNYKAGTEECHCSGFSIVLRQLQTDANQAIQMGRIFKWNNERRK